MTRTQFLLLLYKKLFRPALLLLVAYYAVLFAISLATGDDSSWVWIEMVVCSLVFILVVSGLQKGADYLISKLPPVPAVIAPESKTAKIIGRLSDIALGMVILYAWQINSAVAITMLIYIVYSMISDYNKPKA